MERIVTSATLVLTARRYPSCRIVNYNHCLEIPRCCQNTGLPVHTIIHALVFLLTIGMSVHFNFIPYMQIVTTYIKLKSHLSVYCAAYLPVPVCINFMPKMKHLSSPYFKIIILSWYVLLFALYSAWKAKVWELNKIPKQTVQEVECLTNMQDVVGFNSAGSIIFLCSCTFVHNFRSNC